MLLGLVSLPFMALWGGYRLGRRISQLRAALDDELHCPDGHGNRAYGTWVCQHCRAQFRGWAFAGCPVCQLSCGYVACETCGLSIRNPMAR